MMLQLFIVTYSAGLFFAASPIPASQITACESYAEAWNKFSSASPREDLKHIEVKCEWHEKQPTGE